MSADVGTYTLNGPVDLGQQVLVSDFGRRRPLGDCTDHDLHMARRILYRKCLGLTRRAAEVPARRLTMTLELRALLGALRVELQDQGLAKVRLLSDDAIDRARSRAVAAVYEEPAEVAA